MVPGYIVPVKRLTWHLEVENTCVDLLFSETEYQEYSIVFQSAFSILKWYFRSLVGEELKSYFYSEESSHNV